MKLTLSMILGLSSWALTAVMMHPSIGSLLTFLVNAALLVAMWFRAKHEARKELEHGDQQT
jgi:hypothetical protein